MRSAGGHETSADPSWGSPFGSRSTSASVAAGPPDAASSPQPLADRGEAGRRLAVLLEGYRRSLPLVLGVPRGGVPVAFEIARYLHAELDVLLVRKVGAPDDPEYGLGAVAEGEVVLLDEPRARASGYTRADLDPIVRRETAEIALRAVRFRGSRPPPELAGRTVIVVDDGVATGGTVEAGVRAVRAQKAATVVLALGVAPRSAVVRLRRFVEEVVVACVPPRLAAVGEWYRRFEPVRDEEVLALLERSRDGRPRRPGAATP